MAAGTLVSGSSLLRRERIHAFRCLPCGVDHSAPCKLFTGEPLRRSAHHFAKQNIICASRHHAAGASLQSTSFSLSVPVPKNAVFFLPVTKPPCHAKKLQTGTIIPAFFALFREFAEPPVRFDLCAIQPAQKRVDVLYSLHESDFRLLIFYTNYAIL